MTTKSETYLPRYIAAHNPDRLAFKMCATGEGVTFGQLEHRANQGARVFREAGVEVGDHILLLMENRREFLEICFAADRSGIYYTTASTHLTLDEIGYMAEDCGAILAIISDTFRDVALELDKRFGDHLKILIVGDDIQGFDHWKTETERQSKVPIEDEQQGLDMLYSSGTTGRPKGIKWPLTGAHPGASTMLVELLTSIFGYNSETRYLSPAPLYHAAPLRHSMVTLKVGGTVYLMDKFNAETSLEIIERERITHSQWVPTMFVRMLKLPDDARNSYDLSSMKIAVHAAAPCPVDVKLKMMDWWGPIIHEYYAGTENNGFVSITPEEWLGHRGSVGRVKLGVLHISNEEGEDLPVGEEGDIYFENGHQFEYHNAPQKTASCTNIRGWTTLGDVGRLDAEGYLYLTDRKSYMIISGGVNIYPQETEDILLSHPSILDAAVIGIPNADFGEEVKAVVQLVQDAQASSSLEIDLIHYCRQRLSPIKCPRSIDFRDQLPRTETGKLVKRLLRDEYLK